MITAPSRPARIDLIVDQVLSHWEVAERLVLSRSRQPEHQWPKFEIWWRLRRIQFAGITPSYPRIGAWFGRHHTTIMDGERQFDQALAAWCEVMSALAAIDSPLPLSLVA